MKPHLIELVRNGVLTALFLAGWAAVVHGVGMFSRPAAWIVGGLLLAGCAFLLGIDHSRQRPHPEEDDF